MRGFPGPDGDARADLDLWEVTHTVGFFASRFCVVCRTGTLINQSVLGHRSSVAVCCASTFENDTANQRSALFRFSFPPVA
eukprot:scaffold3854_cov78-Phaeocystis_antarctica.AAC.1